MRRVRKLEMPKVVTAGFLKRVGACVSDARKFKRAWPEGAEFNRKNVLKALAAKLNVFWFICRVSWRVYGVDAQREPVMAALNRIDRQLEKEKSELGISATTPLSEFGRKVDAHVAAIGLRHRKKEATILLKAWATMKKGKKQWARGKKG